MPELSRVTPATADVLRTLLEAEAAVWGLRIVQQTGRPAGSVYPILARLEAGGWVDSQWDETPGRGPRRRLYELTDDGRAGASSVVDQAAARWPARPQHSIARPRPGLA